MKWRKRKQSLRAIPRNSAQRYFDWKLISNLLIICQEILKYFRSNRGNIELAYLSTVHSVQQSKYLFSS